MQQASQNIVFNSKMTDEWQIGKAREGRDHSQIKVSLWHLIGLIFHQNSLLKHTI